MVAKQCECAACFDIERGELEAWLGFPTSVPPAVGEDTDGDGHRLETWEGTAQPVPSTTGQLRLRLHAAWGGFAGAELTVEVLETGLLKGQLLQPAFASLANSGGRKPRRRLPSYYFTGYSRTQGCECFEPSRQCGEARCNDRMHRRRTPRVPRSSRSSTR